MLWYLLIAATVGILILAFFIKSWILTLVAMALALFLKRNNRKIPLPKVYRDLGVSDDLFE